MTIFHSVILGIIEGITEFLPISSTGHLILAGHILSIPGTDFLKSFEIIIQLGAILAVIVLFWQDFLDWRTLKKLVVGSIPTAIIGFGLYKIIKNNLLGSEHVVLWALLLGGIVLIIFESLYKGPDITEETPGEISYLQSFFIGIFQSLAIIPGVSRSAATIIGGLALGIPRRAIVEFSFLLAVPTMIGASGLDIIKSGPTLLKGNLTFLIVGFITSFIVAIFSIKFLMNYIKKHNFTPFGIYRVIIALLFFFVIF